jgi:predicted dehydrogenase
MAIKAAFMGFRHPHILAAYDYIEENMAAEEGLIIAACCEEDEKTREELQEQGRIKLTHSSFRRMIEEVDFDLLVVGDYFGKRGGIIKSALKEGKHVLSDKPLCTSRKELERIADLAEEKGLAVGALLELRYSGNFIKVREMLRDGAIGPVHSIAFSGQHPLLLGTRGKWYNEPGRHGGTVNDLLIHGMDTIIWTTGMDFKDIISARNWNAGIGHWPHFRNGAQVMLTMENGCGVIGDLTYISPDSFGYTLPLYWRLTFWGEKGVIESGYNWDHINLFAEGEEQVRQVEPSSSIRGGAIEACLRLIKGSARDDDYSTAGVLEMSRFCLKAQEAADRI